jgi:hypothetical protein
MTNAQMAAFSTGRNRYERYPRFYQTAMEYGSINTLYLKKLTKIELLAQNPKSGIDRTNELGENIRSALVGSHTIYYEYDGEMLTIQAVLHQAMTPEIHLRQNKNE